jgi:hypothetical protein
LSDLATLATLAAQALQTVSPWAALFVAWRTFKHNKDTVDQAKVATDAGTAATTAATVASIITTVNKIFADLKEEAERFRKHDNDCARDKAQLAAHLEANTQTIAAVVRTVNNLERRVGYAARDEAARATYEKLTGEAR